MKLLNKFKDLSKYGIVLTFFALEVFAFLAFSFGNSFLLFGILSLVLAVLGIIFYIKELRKDDFYSLAYFLFPLGLYVILTALSIYSRAHAQVGDFSVGEVIFVPVGIISIAICGYIFSLNKTFKIKHFLIVIYSALALLVFINLLINMINFGAFYTLIYKGYYMYYGGKRSDVPVNEIAYVLERFKFVEVDISYYTMFPILLLTSSFMLFKSSYKKDKYYFISYIGFTALAILALVLVPSIVGLIYVIALAVIFGLIILLNKKKELLKPAKIALIVLISLAALVLLIMILNNQDFSKGIANIIANNALLNKIFNTNKFARLYNPNLTNIFSGERFLGYCVHQITELYQEEAHLTGSVLFDNFMTSGVIGNVAFFITLFIGYKGFAKYKEQVNLKGTLLSFVVIYFLYIMIFYNGEYGVFHSIYKPTFMTSTFMLMVFIFSYVRMSETKEETKNENI